MPMTTSLLEGAETAGQFLMKAGSGIGRVFGGKHLKYTLMGAAALGVASEHPFHGGYDHIVNQGIFGTSHATRTLGMGAMGGAINGALGYSGASQSMGIPSSQNIPISPLEVPPPPQTSSLQGPDGSIVFGMHNLRA